MSFTEGFDKWLVGQGKEPVDPELVATLNKLAADDEAGKVIVLLWKLAEHAMNWKKAIEANRTDWTQEKAKEILKHGFRVFEVLSVLEDSSLILCPSCGRSVIEDEWLSEQERCLYCHEEEI